MSTQGHGMIEEPDTVEARYLPKCLSGDNHQGNCHNYVFDYVYLHDLTFGAHGCTAHQMEIFAQDFEPASYFCDWTCVHLITSRQK